MNIEEVINNLKKYISFSEKECNFPSIWDWNWHMDLANDIKTLLTDYEKEKEENEQWKKYATNDLENQITERNNKIFKIEAELEKEKEKNKKEYDKGYKEGLVKGVQPQIFENWNKENARIINIKSQFVSKDKIKPIQIIDLDGKIHNVYKIEEE